MCMFVLKKIFLFKEYFFYINVYYIYCEMELGCVNNFFFFNFFVSWCNIFLKIWFFL